MNWADFHFIRPYWLLLLLPMIVVIIMSLRHRLSQGNWSDVCDKALLPFILQQSQSKPHNLRLFALSLASLLVILSLAGPAWDRLPSPAFRSDSSLVIILDLSKSMDANDIKPSRLIRAHYKIADILEKRKDGLTALLVYAADAFTVTPLTQDTATISNLLNSLSTQIMPSQGSNTLAALQHARSLMKQAGQIRGDILLITDGITPHIIQQAPDILGHYQLSLFGVGTEQGAPITLANGGFLKNAQGGIVIPKLKTDELASLANAGNGIYQTISTDDRDTNAFLAFIEQHASHGYDQESQHIVEQWDEKGPWLLLLLLPLMASYFRKGILIVPFITLSLLQFPQESHAFSWQDLWQTQDQQAQHAFSNDEFERAAEQFQSPQWQAASDYKAGNYQQAADTLATLNTAEAHYNRANALTKLNQLQQAVEAYQDALELDPAHQDAQFNKDMVEKALKQQQQNQQSDQEKQQGEQQQPQNQDSQSEQNQSDDKQQGDEPQQSNDQQQSSNEQDSDKKSTEKLEAESKDKSDEDKPKYENNDAEQKEMQTQSAEEQKMNETDRATEQWLKRIPDDPSGLLTRKFKYQYQQRKQRTQQEQQW